MAYAILLNSIVATQDLAIILKDKAIFIAIQVDRLQNAFRCVVENDTYLRLRKNQ